jgi:hypothetical protein
MYLKPYEAGLSQSAAETAQALFGYGGGVTKRLADADHTLRRYDRAFSAGDDTVIDLATGKLASDRRNSLAPVLAARMNAAKGRAAAISQGLDETLSALRAAKAGTGFRGLSTFDINRAQAATIGARTNAAAGLGDAELANALATQGLDESNLQLRLNSLDLPAQIAQQRLSLSNLPASNIADFYGRALSPLSFFRMGAGTPPYQQTPQIPIITSSGQIAGSAVAGFGQSLGQYFAQQQMMQDLSKFYGGGPTYLGSGGSLGAGSWAGPGGAPASSGIGGQILGLS